ncbi:MAG: hypothetical protein EHM55_19525 [Acidobacteria bacterium]|nr:MAG: hypothetical protein EHM55_19525 [Acidobacteriota bacterium]
MKKDPGTFLCSILAAVTAGVALWLSRASFDVAGTLAAPERVAMLPSAAELLGLVVLALLVAAGIASLSRTAKNRDVPFWDGASDALLPLFGLAVLIVPYLPLIPDWVPALRLLAGPSRIFIWIVVLGQVVWLLSPRVGASKSALIFACTSVFLSAPFVMNVRATPAILGDLVNTIRHVPSATWSAVPAGSLGSLFDQEYGIFAYAPVLLLAFVGLAGMARDRSRIAIPLAAAILVLIVLPGTVDPWWSKSMLPGRHLFFLLPLLVPPIAWLYARLPDESFQRAGAQGLLLTSLAVTLILVMFGDRVPALQEGDGVSALLYWMSPTWQLWSEAPTYIADATTPATVRVLIWLGVFGLSALILSRRKSASPGRAALAVTTITTALVIAVITTTAAFVSSPDKRFNVEGRVTLPLLETFDPVARPIAVRYDALSLVTPDRLPPLFTLSAVPGSRTAPQPVRVVLNARFRLPAGEYVLDLKGAESAVQDPNSAIALQVGREGRPVQAWPLALPAGGHVREPFQLPLDAEFVGFRAPRQVEQNIAELRITPVSVVETRRRFPAATVLSAAAFAPATIFFHDSNAYTEPEGFWVKGRAKTRMTLRKRSEHDSRVVLAIHSGARPNAVEVSVPGWSQKLDLVPGVTQRVLIPTKEGQAFVPLTISAADGFVPAEIEASRDRRLLGAWIAFIPDDISRTSAAP